MLNERLGDLSLIDIGFTEARFPLSILEECGRLRLKCLLLSYFRVGDNLPGTCKLTFHLG
jgi:hypothetical protein